MHQKFCWWCEHFAPNGVANGGECRRFAPSGISSNIFADTAPIQNVFPVSFDGTIDWCGDFKPNSAPVPDPS